MGWSLGLIESLLTLRLVDEITETRGRGNKECVAQGIANTATGMFGGMGGCAMIGQSMINVNSGGRGRLSGITAALSLLLFILFPSSLIEQIPLAALIGVMFIVVIGTFEWSSFRVLRKVPRSDAMALVLVSAVTVATDLAILLRRAGSPVEVNVIEDPRYFVADDTLDRGLLSPVRPCSKVSSMVRRYRIL